ncbi:MAG: PD-(D/E)XK nuclease family protein, partial [Campylobacteraceae bacterium]
KYNELFTCNLNTKTALSSKKLYEEKTSITFQPFSTRAAQVGFVFYQIEQMVSDGILPENIAIILPDENFAPILKELDTLNNLNFAMGISIKNTLYYKKLNALLKYKNDDELENVFRSERLGLKTEDKNLLHVKSEFEKMTLWLSSFLDENTPKAEKDLIDETLFVFEKFLQNLKVDLTYEEVLILFLNRLKEKTIDDINGGKVTVIGLLESRGAKYDGVIIVDFNDDFVPKRSQKDMFLSTSIRLHVNLPTSDDREDLQRFFYDRVIKNAKKVAISCVVNEEKTASRFLKTLSVKEENFDEDEFTKLLFKAGKNRDIFRQENIIQNHDFFYKPLSNSRLKCYLDCKRRYYFTYIKNFQEAQIPTDELNAKDMGTTLHEVLKKLFQNPANNALAFEKKAKELLKEMGKNSIDFELECDIWLLKLREFFEEEARRYKEGWRVVLLEEKFTAQKNGVILEGYVDRIDKRDDTYLVLDYKSGNLSIEQSLEKAQNATNFQLQFYSLLCENLGNLAEPLYYRLENAKLLNEPFFNEKKEKLFEHIEELKNTKEFNFI